MLTLLLPSKGQPIHQVKCNLKEIAGELNDNPELKAEGTGEKLDGKVQEKICKI
ncbi:MAG: CsbD family protein [Desulfobacteraceae bacterium]|nr:MAG: CsbD family protein [Desulfobacteraceae bacterium]